MSGDHFKPRRGCGTRVLGWAIAAVVGLAMSAGAHAQGLMEVQTSRNSYFYRMAVETAYRGQPLTIDVVVACSVRITSSRLTGTSRDPAWMPSPLYAVRMPDNKAVAVQTVDACDGQTTDDGRVPPDFLPFMIVYANADEMTFGIGYISEEAYENKTAELTRPKATIRRASEQEWRRWRETAPRNALRPEMRERRLEPGRTAFGHACSAFRRLEIPESVRDAVAALRPADALRYWTPGKRTGAVQDLLFTRTRGTPVQSPLYDGRHWGAFGVSDRGPIGLATRNGGGEIVPRYPWLQQRSSAPTFPLKYDLYVPWIGPHLHLQDVFYVDAIVESDDVQGFAYCHTMTVSSEAGFGGPYDTIPGKKKQVLRVDGQIVQSDEGFFLTWLILDRDRFVFRNFSINLGAIEGID